MFGRDPVAEPPGAAGAADHTIESAAAAAAPAAAAASVAPIARAPAFAPNRISLGDGGQQAATVGRSDCGSLG